MKNLPFYPLPTDEQQRVINIIKTDLPPGDYEFHADWDTVTVWCIETKDNKQLAPRCFSSKKPGQKWKPIRQLDPPLG